jgi:DNA-binding response OmpR family regulator
MKPLALIIDDDPEIREQLKERLESLGHECFAVGSQNEAEEKFKQHTFSYVLLDLEIPIRYGRVPAKSMGENTLRKLRTDPRNGNTPVLMITAHGKEGPNLAVRLMKMGAVDFINKPFDETLEASITEALQKHAGKHLKKEGFGDSMSPFPGGELVFSEEGVDLIDARLVRSSATGYRVLRALASKTASGIRVAMSGKKLATSLRLERGEEAVNEAIKALRQNMRKVMANKNLRVETDSLIGTGPNGYSLAPGITWSEGPPALQDSEEPKKLTKTERLGWFRKEVLAGKRLRRRDYEREFGVSEATAKRDLAEIQGIVFSGGGPNGYYMPKDNARGVKSA